MELEVRSYLAIWIWSFHFLEGSFLNKFTQKCWLIKMHINFRRWMNVPHSSTIHVIFKCFVTQFPSTLCNNNKESWISNVKHFTLNHSERLKHLIEHGNFGKIFGSPLEVQQQTAYKSNHTGLTSRTKKKKKKKQNPNEKKKKKDLI